MRNVFCQSAKQVLVNLDDAVHLVGVKLGAGLPFFLGKKSGHLVHILANERDIRVGFVSPNDFDKDFLCGQYWVRQNG